MNPEPAQKIVTTDNLEHLSDLPQPSVVDVQNTNGPESLLLKLPTELRFIILGDCIASGDLQFMRASRALLNDGQAIICGEGVYRILLGAGDDENGQCPSNEVVKTIQNLDVTVVWTDWRFVYSDLERLESFADPQIYRKCCNILLKIFDVSNFLAGLELCRVLRRCAAFQKIVLRIEIDRAKPIGQMIHHLQWGDDGLSGLFYPMLGAPDVTVDKDGFVMTFFPRKHAREVAEGFGRQSTVM